MSARILRIQNLYGLLEHPPEERLSEEALLKLEGPVLAGIQARLEAAWCRRFTHNIRQVEAQAQDMAHRNDWPIDKELKKVG